MKYFLDTEFLEGKQDKTILGFKYGETKPTIDMISIGIISEDNREYYAISKEFNLKEAWNRFQLEQQSGDMRNVFPKGKKIYWLRHNILKPIYDELFQKWQTDNNSLTGDEYVYFNYYNLKKLINKYGKTNKEIADDIIKFCKPLTHSYHRVTSVSNSKAIKEINIPIVNTDRTAPEFYAYYADYDWVVFCWLFGKMINLPNGFPMYCIDLKQELDKVAKNLYYKCGGDNKFNDVNDFLEREFKKWGHYPKQTNEHNALADAHFNKELCKFLNEF